MRKVSKNEFKENFDSMIKLVARNKSSFAIKTEYGNAVLIPEKDFIYFAKLARLI